MKDYLDNCLQVSYNYLGNFFMGWAQGIGLNGLSNTGGGGGYWIQGCDAPQYMEHHHNIIVGPCYMSNMAFANVMHRGTIDYHNNTTYRSFTSITPGAPCGAFRIYNNIMDGPFAFWYNFSGSGQVPLLQPPETWPGPGSLIDYNAYAQTATFGFALYPGEPSAPPGYNPVTLSRWQTPGSKATPPCPPDFPGFDQHSITYARTAGATFLASPQSAVISSFRINPASPVAHAGIGRAICGALDGSGTVGCDF